MKKLLALALAVVMMMAIALPTFAAPAESDKSQSERYGDGNDVSTNDNYLEDAKDQYTKPDVEIKYGVAQAYTVTIPETISLHQYNGEKTSTQTTGYVYGIHYVSVDDVVIAKDEFLNIYLSSANTKKTTPRKWILLDKDGTNATVTYAVRTDKYLNGEISGIADDAGIFFCAPAKGNEGTTGSSKTGTLYFSSKGTAVEGTYADLLTFTVKIEKEACSILNDEPVVETPDVEEPGATETTDPSIQG